MNSILEAMFVGNIFQIAGREIVRLGVLSLLKDEEHGFSFV